MSIVKKNKCIEFAMLSESVYRTFLDLIKYELDSAGIIDINPIQAAVLLNIVNADQIAKGDVLKKGYYMGSNASYNLNKMKENGYIDQIQSEFDKRISYLRLTDKGVRLSDSLNEKISSHSQSIESNTSEKTTNIGKLITQLRSVENHWKKTINTANRISQ